MIHKYEHLLSSSQSLFLRASVEYSHFRIFLFASTSLSLPVPFHIKMKISAPTTLFFGLLVSNAAARRSRPGQCKTDKDCDRYGGATCVSVENDIVNVELASQCVFGDPQTEICGGLVPGKCPTFSSWTKKYQDIQPICAFIDPGNCGEPGATSEENKRKNKVECATLVVPGETKRLKDIKVTGIYACVDRQMYVNENLGHTKNQTDTHLENCAGNETVSDALLCNGQGTCAADGKQSLNYRCQCNLGYSESDNCFEASSNACDAFGQCGEGGSCNTDKSSCECEEGVSGDQCSGCQDDTGCNGQGTCVKQTVGSEVGDCKCNEGFEGDFCAKRQTDDDSDDATAVQHSIIAAMSCIALVLSLIM